MEEDELLPIANERKKGPPPALPIDVDEQEPDKVIQDASKNDTVDPTSNGSSGGSHSVDLEIGADNHRNIKESRHFDGQSRRITQVLLSNLCNTFCCNSGFLKEWIRRRRLALVVVGFLIIEAVTVVSYERRISEMDSLKMATEIPTKYENGTRSSWTFTSSICFNDPMWRACSGGSRYDSSMQLLCSFLTCSVSVDPMAASDGKEYQQLCKSFHMPGIKGMDHVCYTCLGYNSSHTSLSDITANQCLFIPATLQHSYPQDGNSAWLAIRSNDPERWMKSSHCLSTDAMQLLDLACSPYIENGSPSRSLNFVQPVCRLEKQCFDIINLHFQTSDAGEGPPSVCDQGEVLSRAANGTCISTKDWLGRWLKCCP